ncbi:MAG: NADH-quinone oxidoreductase subunit NuoK [Rickettsiaceae bacterium]|nr:NADH-quinone oxidoreductase subunit NuoK [Rickettsiaceae bacterium]
MELSISEITKEHFLILSIIIFSIGAFGLITNRKNVITALMSIELMLLAANINFIAFSYYLSDITGQIASIVVLTIAAAEAAIGLAIVVSLYRSKNSISMSNLNNLKG